MFTIIFGIMLVGACSLCYEKLSKKWQDMPPSFILGSRRGHNYNVWSDKNKSGSSGASVRRSRGTSGKRASRGALHGPCRVINLPEDIENEKRRRHIH